jgi:mannosyltransferase
LAGSHLAGSMTLQKGKNKSFIVELSLLVGIILLAALFRFYKLGAWSFWGDEAFTLSGKEDGFNYSIFRRSLAVDLIQLSTQYLGMSEWSARLAPAIIGVLTVAVLYLLMRNLFDRKMALIASALLAISTWHLYWSQNARFYSLLLLFYTAGLLAFYKGFEEDRPGWVLASLVLFGLAARERLIALFFAPVIVAYLALVWLLPFEKPKGLRLRNLLVFFGPAAIVGAAFALPYLRNLGGWLVGFGRVNNDPLWLAAGLVYYVGVPTVAAAAFGALYLLSKKNRAGLFFGLSAALPVLAVMVLSLFQYTANRYFFVTLTSWIILAALAVYELFIYLRGRQQILAFGVLAILLGASLGEDLMYFRFQNGNRDNWKAAVQYVQEHRTPNDIVVSANPDVSDLYLGHNTIPLLDWDPASFTSPGRAWILEDMNVQEMLPGKLEWLRENARQVADFDVHVQARNFKMRVYLYTPPHTVTKQGQ